MDIDKEMEFIITMIFPNIKANFTKIWGMAKVQLFIQNKNKFIKVVGIWIWRVVMGNMNIQMEAFIKANLKMARGMEKVYFTMDLLEISKGFKDIG